MSNIANAIMATLTDAGGEVSAGHILEQVRVMAGASPQSVKNELRMLLLAGTIRKTRHGYYSLPHAGSHHTQEESGIMAFIPLASVRASAGTGAYPMATEIEDYIAINRQVLRSQTGINPERLHIMVATGTSMVPTIMPGDRILVATRNGDPIIGGAIYVWRSRWDGVVIKRAILLGDGQIALQGDNEADTIGKIHPADDDPAWTIIAKVVGVQKPL